MDLNYPVPSGSNCTDLGDSCGFFDVTDGQAGTPYIGKYTQNGDQGNCYIVGYVYFTDVDGMTANGHRVDFVTMTDSSGTRDSISVYLSLYYATDHLEFIYYYWNGSSYDYMDLGDTSPSDSTWYPFRLTYEAGSKAQIEVDWNDDGDFGDANESETDESDIGSRECEIAWFGIIYRTSSNADADLVIDNIKIDDDTMPGLCSR